MPVVLNTVYNQILMNAIEDTSSIESYFQNIKPALDELTKEMSNYNRTHNFIQLLNSLKINAHKYVVQFGESPSNTETSFLSEIKTLYNNSESLKNIDFIYDLFEIKKNKNIDDLKSVPRNFVFWMDRSILTGMIQTIVDDYNRSEFIIAGNLAIIDNNFNALKIKEKVMRINKYFLFLEEQNTNQTAKALERKVRFLEILETSKITQNGDLDFGKLLYGIPEAYVNNVLSAYKVIKLLLNTSINEIKIKTGQNQIVILNGVIPSKSSKSNILIPIIENQAIASTTLRIFGSI